MPATAPTIEALQAHADFLQRLASALLRDEHRAQDVVQEAFARALARPPRRSDRLGPWLGRVVRNLSLNELRAQGRRQVHEHGSARPESLPATDDIVARETVRQHVLKVVTELTDPYREVVLLRYYEDLPPRAIAQQLGRPVETVRTQLKRGLTQLQQRLDRTYGGDRGAWCLPLVPFAVRGSRGVLSGTALGSLVAFVVLGGGLALWFGMGSPDVDASDSGAGGQVTLQDLPTRNAPPEVAGPPQATREPVPAAPTSPPPATPDPSEEDFSEADITAFMKNLSMPAFGGGTGEPPEGVLEGFLLDADGEPLEEADITLHRRGDPDFEETTWSSQDEGSYAFLDLPSGTYDLRAFAVGHGANALQGIEYVEGTELLLPDLTLASPGVLTGRLTDPDGSPVQLLWVAAVHVSDDLFELTNSDFREETPKTGRLRHATRRGGQPYGWAQTDRDGNFEIIGLVPGTYRLQLEAPARFVGAQPPIGPAGGSALDGVVESHRIWPLARPESGEWEGTDFQFALWKAARGEARLDELEASLSLEPGHFDELPVPDKEGYFSSRSLLPVSPGDLVLIQAELPDCYRERRLLRVGPEDRELEAFFVLREITDAQWAHLSIEVAGGAEELPSVCHHTVIDSQTGRRCQGIDHVRRDLYRLRPGRCRVETMAPGKYLDVVSEVELKPGARLTVTHEPRPGGTIELTAIVPATLQGDPGRVDVQVEDLDRGETHDETVFLARPEPKTRRLGPVPPGAYRLRLVDERFLELEQVVQVRELEATRVVWELVER